MTLEEQQIQEQISGIWQETDNFLASYNNSLLLFDFTTLYQFENNKTKIKSIYQYKIPDYSQLFLSFLSNNGNNFISKDEEGTPIEYDSRNNAPISVLDDPIPDIYNPGDANDTKIVKIKTWHEFVEEKKIANACWTLFEDFFEFEDTKEKIVVGVYILLKEIMGQNQKVISDFISHEVYKFLFGRGRAYFTKEYKEKFKQLERLKTQTMFSLTTHSLKTHLDTGVIKLKNAFKEKLNSYPTLLNEFSELDEETEELRKLTSLLSLIDKIDNRAEFVKEAKKSNLLTEANVNYDLSAHLTKFNSRHAAMPDVEVKSDAIMENFAFSLPVFGLYFSDRLLNLFFNTLFENVISYGKCDKNKIVLAVELGTGYWTFSNETEDETIPFDPTKIKGNLRLFQLLIKETNSGSFLIDNTQKHSFKIEIKTVNHE